MAPEVAVDLAGIDINANQHSQQISLGTMLLTLCVRLLFVPVGSVFSRDQLRTYLEETNSDNVFQHGAVAKELQALGRYAEAIREWEKTLELNGNQHLADSLASANAKQGYRGALQVLAAGLEAEAAHTYVPRIVLAQSQIAIGNKDRALFWLEKAYEEHNWCMLYLTMDPGWAPLRSDPRFIELTRRVGLPQQ